MLLSQKVCNRVSGSILLLLSLSCVACSLDEYEVCSNGAAETIAQSTAPVEVQSSQASQSEVDTSPTQAPSETEDGAGGHDDSCSTDDDQFSEVGEAPDTEVMAALHLLQTASAQAEAIHEGSCACAHVVPAILFVQTVGATTCACWALLACAF